MARDMMSEEESAFHENFVLATRAPNEGKPASHRLVLDGMFWIARKRSPYHAATARLGYRGDPNEGNASWKPGPGLSFGTKDLAKAYRTGCACDYR